MLALAVLLLFQPINEQCKMAVTKEVFILDNGACTAKVGVSNAELPRYVT